MVTGLSPEPQHGSLRRLFSAVVTVGAWTWTACRARQFASKLFVTGGAGFIGSHVCETFTSAGYEVLTVDNLSTGRRENVPSAARFELLDITIQTL